MNKVINYNEAYESGSIKLTDIPFSSLSLPILKKAALTEIEDYIILVCKLYEMNNDINWMGLAALSHSVDVMQSICIEVFKINPSEDTFKKILNSYKTKEMWIYMFNIDPMKYFALIPSKYMNQDMCVKMFELDELTYFDKIPKKFRTQEMYNRMFEIDCVKYFDLIPQENITKEMCNKMFGINPLKYFEHIPDKYITQDMCDKLFKRDPVKYFALIPVSFRTKQMWKTLLQRDFKSYTNILPSDVIDDDIINIARVEMKKIYNKKNMIHKDKISQVELIVISKYEEFSDFVYIPLEQLILMQTERIKSALYSLIVVGGTIEEIARDLNVEITVIYEVLAKIKKEDLVNYELIKKVLEGNQKSYIFNMINDIHNLSLIIDCIGKTENDAISMEQKLKFIYLYGKYIYNSLEDIYNFNYAKYNEGDSSNIKLFFKQVLHFNVIYNSDLIIPEKDTLEYNNSWLRKYYRDRFFAIKDGRVTMQYRYGKKSELLTMEMEEKILNILKLEKIPLYEIIVKTAFREYFNGNLSEYIEKLKSYDAEYELFRCANRNKK